MKDNRLESYKRWDKVADYESDCDTVALLNDKGKAVAEFNYPGFTRKEFELFKYGGDTDV